MIKEDKISDSFERVFKTQEGNLYSAPGRINIIGEHTDYNEGFVFPGAIDKGIMAKVRVNGTTKVRLHSIDMNDDCVFDLVEDQLPEPTWARYIYGVCREMEKLGVKVNGFDSVFAGDIPLGAGLSSSAALESCYACAINDLFADNQISKEAMAKVGQMTEHHFVGVNCGIMDQFASVFGKKGYLVRLDCRSMAYEYFPFDPQAHGYRLVLVDSVVKHELVDSPYNRRRESCERVAFKLGLPSLREADMEMLNKIKAEISEEDYMRARFVIGEKQRVLDVCDALQKNDYETVGKRMFETHEGLSKEYEVSCEELDFLNEIAYNCGVTGSRIMGGGFGGCTINLVKVEFYQGFIDSAVNLFSTKYGHKPKIYDVIISDGAKKYNS